MSKDSESPLEKVAKPIRRLGTGVLSLVQVICVLVLYMALNYLGYQHHVPKDLSSEAAYTLSSATRRYLASPAIQQRSEPIRLLLGFRRSTPLYEKVRVLADEYARLSNGKIKLEPFDPLRQPNRAQQVVDEFGPAYNQSFKKTIFNTDLMIFDARTKEEREKTSPTAAKTSPNVHFIEAEAMGRFETDQHGQRRLTGFRGEDTMTAGLQAAVEGKPRKVYLLADKSGYTAESGDGALKSFEAAMASQNAMLVPLRLAEIESVPADAAAIAIINPAYDFTPAEAKVLDDYWQRPKSGILVTLGASETPPTLRAFLMNQGITPGRDRVLTVKNGQVTNTVRGVFEPGYDFTQDFAGKTTLFEGATCSLGVQETYNDALTSKRIMPMTLMLGGEEFWGETRFAASDTPTMNPREDIRGPVALAGGVIRGAASRDDVGDQVSRMVAISNSDFLSPKYLSDINRSFLVSSMNWLMGRQELTGEGPITLGTYKLPLLDSQLSLINRMNLFFLPAIALLIGAIVWSSRRA